MPSSSVAVDGWPGVSVKIDLDPVGVTDISRGPDPINTSRAVDVSEHGAAVALSPKPMEVIVELVFGGIRTRVLIRLCSRFLNREVAQNEW